MNIFYLYISLNFSGLTIANFHYHFHRNLQNYTLTQKFGMEYGVLTWNSLTHNLRSGDARNLVWNGDTKKETNSKTGTRNIFFLWFRQYNQTNL